MVIDRFYLLCCVTLETNYTEHKGISFQSSSQGINKCLHFVRFADTRKKRRSKMDCFATFRLGD
jgi:hypothetical protein